MKTGHTDLATVDTETGNILSISQRPYNLPLKQTAWVQRELETLEKVGINVQSVAAWTSLIVLVSKQTQLGGPPLRLCVDYRALNNLLHPVTKAHAKAKGVLTLVFISKMEIYSILDLRSDY